MILAARLSALAWCILCTSTLAAQDAATTCLAYEPDTVTISGTLVRRTYPGPPNYESLERGDKPETHFYLVPVTSLCTRSGAEPDINPRKSDIKLVQLVVDSAGHTQLRPYLDTLVTLRGTLFSAITGHHHAPLLLRVLNDRMTPDDVRSNQRLHLMRAPSMTSD